MVFLSARLNSRQMGDVPMYFFYRHVAPHEVSAYQAVLGAVAALFIFGKGSFSCTINCVNSKLKVLKTNCVYLGANLTECVMI